MRCFFPGVSVVGVANSSSRFLFSAFAVEPGDRTVVLLGLRDFFSTASAAGDGGFLLGMTCFSGVFNGVFGVFGFGDVAEGEDAGRFPTLRGVRGGLCAAAALGGDTCAGELRVGRYANLSRFASAANAIDSAPSSRRGDCAVLVVWLILLCCVCVVGNKCVREEKEK